MPISGPVVHQQLMDAYQHVQSNLESERSEILQSKEQRDELTDERGEALVSLAEHYLPELTRGAIEQTWIEVRDSIAQVLHRKEEHARRVQNALNDLTSRREQQEKDLVSINGQLDQAVDARQELADEVEKQLSGDQQFVELTDRAAVAEAALERAEANLEEIDQDSARKLPAYEDSTLFRYLYDRGYGTAKYAKRGFTRRMDRMLAKYIDFGKAKQGYDFLRKTPEHMRQIIAEDREDLDTVMDELERRRDDVAKKLGLPEKIQLAVELEKERGQQLNSLGLLQQELDQAQQQVAEVEDTRGTYYRQAIKLFRDMLDRSDARDLKRRAEQTREITDDQIVARLVGVESEIGQLDDNTRRRRDALDHKRRFLEDLGRLVQRFRAAQFDSSRSRFVGSLDIFEEIDRAEDEGDTDRLWKRIRSAQRWGSIAAEEISEAAVEPLAAVLVNAMAYAAGRGMGALARRAGHRRAQRNSNRGDCNRGDSNRGDWDGDWGSGSGSGAWGGDSSRDWRRRR